MQVAGRTLQLGLGLGLTLAAVLALGKGGLPRLFTGDAAVLAAIGHIFPWVILSQPINALAFVWDGILYGAGGFSYAAKVSRQTFSVSASPYTLVRHLSALCSTGATRLVPAKELCHVLVGVLRGKSDGAAGQPLHSGSYEALGSGGPAALSGQPCRAMQPCSDPTTPASHSVLCRQWQSVLHRRWDAC